MAPHLSSPLSARFSSAAVLLVLAAAVLCGARAQVVKPSPSAVPVPPSVITTVEPVTIIVPTIVIDPTDKNKTGPWDTTLYFDAPYDVFVVNSSSPQAQAFAWRLLVALVTPPMSVVAEKIVLLPLGRGIVAVVTVKTEASVNDINTRAVLYGISFEYEGVLFVAQRAPPPPAPSGLSINAILGIIIGALATIFVALVVLSYAQQAGSPQQRKAIHSVALLNINGSDGDDEEQVLEAAARQPLLRSPASAAAALKGPASPPSVVSTLSPSTQASAWDNVDVSQVADLPAEWGSPEALMSLDPEGFAAFFEADMAALSSLPSDTSPTLDGRTPVPTLSSSAALSSSVPSLSSSPRNPASPSTDDQQENLGPALFVAVQYNNVHQLRELLLSGANPNYTNSHQQTALMAAACNDSHLEALDTLVKMGVDVEAVDEDGWPALMYAARYGALESVNILLGLKCNPTVRDARGMTPLMHAAAHNHDSVVQRLLRVRAPLINAQDVNGWSALHWVAASNACDAAVCLLGYSRMSLRMLTSAEETVLHIAARHGHLEMVELLTSTKPSETKWLVAAATHSMLTAEDMARSRGFAQVVAFLEDLRLRLSTAPKFSTMRRTADDSGDAPPAKQIKTEY